MKMPATEIQDTVKAALNALYHGPSDVVRAQADGWLQDFQRTIDAWQVADNLLHDPNSNLETLLFCSQILRTKVQRDFEELPSEAFCPLRDSLYILLKKLADGPPKVRTQICVAVAALAVHVAAEDWGGGGILYWLRDEMNSHPEWTPSFLELLSVLPQEASSYKIAVRPERRRQFEKELISLTEIALDLLTTCLRVNNLREQVLEAFSSWIRLCSGISQSTLASHPLVHAALSGLIADGVSDAAANAVSELIHYTVAERSGGLLSQMLLVQVLVPPVMKLKSHLKDSSMDEEDVKTIARLFADMGDAYVELIATGTDESLLIVNALLDVSSHSEYDIASMAFNFWHSLRLNLMARGAESHLIVQADRGHKLQIFRPVYELLLSLMYARVHFPAKFQQLSNEDSKDFEKTRYGAGDVLVDAAAVLGGDCTLHILYTKLIQGLGNCGNDNLMPWEPIEAALYGINAIACLVPISEDKIMPQVMTLLPKLPQYPRLLQTACLTVEAYSKWLNAASSDLLHPIMELLVHGMSVSDSSATVAALAFKDICGECRGKLCRYLDGLLKIYHHSVSSSGEYKLSSEDVLYLIEGLSMVVSEFPTAQGKEAVELLLLPVVTPLQELVIQGPGAMEQVTSYHLLVHIDRLAVIFRCVYRPEAVADAVQKAWPIFKAIFEFRGWDMRTMESLSSACRYAVKSAGNLVVPTVGLMLEEIKVLYRVHSQPCFLYLSSEVIKKFGCEPACRDYLAGLVEALFHHTMQILKTFEDFTLRPDIVDDCFLLASRCLRYCPGIFIPSPIFSPLVSCALVGIPIQHREACLSILNFFSDILHLARSLAQSSFKDTVDLVMIAHGADFTRVLIASLAGALPSSRVEEVSNVLVDLVRTYGSKVIEWAKECVSRIPFSVLTEVEQSRFIQSLLDALSGASYSDFIVPIEELSDICRRNRTVVEIVQEALKPLQLSSVSAPLWKAE